MRVIGLAGYAQSGKDTVADILVTRGFRKASFATPLRKMLYAINPIVAREEGGGGAPIRYAEMIDSVGYETTKRLDEVRALLQRLGTDAGRNVLGQDVWVRAAMRQLAPNGRYVFTDVRFPNEAAAIENCGGEVWRVVRPGTEPVNGHPSETALDGYCFDHIVDNGGSLKDLAESLSWA